MAKRKIEWSVEAKESLLNILDFYTERNGNKTYTNKLLRQIKKSISFISTNHFIGKNTDEEKTRVLFKGHYGIFYEVKDKVIEIQLVWDNRRNPGELFYK